MAWRCFFEIEVGRLTVRKNNPKGEVPSGLVSAGYPLGRKHPSKENVPQNHRVIFDMDQASTDQRWGYFFGTEMIKLTVDAEAS